MLKVKVGGITETQTPHGQKKHQRKKNKIQQVLMYKKVNNGSICTRRRKSKKKCHTMYKRKTVPPQTHPCLFIINADFGCDRPMRGSRTQSAHRSQPSRVSLKSLQFLDVTTQFFFLSGCPAHTPSQLCHTFPRPHP